MTPPSRLLYIREWMAARLRAPQGLSAPILASRLGLAGAAAAAACGLAHFCLNWQRLNPDGPSYVDLGQRLLASGLARGWSAHWSPLYGLSAAVAAQLAEARGLHPLAGVQALNALFYLANLAACLAFTRELLYSLAPESGGRRAGLFQLVSVSLFCTITVRFGWATLVTPDLAVSLLALVSAALTLRFLRNPTARGSALAGAALGVAYWFKSVALPLFLWWFLVVLWVLRKRPSERRRLAWAVLVWLVLVAPLVGITSRAAGKFTIGESGRHAWLWYVQGSFYVERADGRRPLAGAVRHPVPTLLEDPKVYFFGDRFPEATYALWYDPYHWQAGAELRLSAAESARAFLRNSRAMLRVWLSRTLLPFFVLLVCAAPWLVRRDAGDAPRFVVLFAGLPVLALLFLHAEMRFFYAQFVMLVTVGGLSLCFGERERRRSPLAVLLLAIAFWGLAVSLVHGVPRRTSSAAVVAEAAARGGVREGMRVCTIGDLNGSAWAWYARVRVVAELPLAEYRRVTGAGRNLGEEVLRAFDAAGCQAAVATLAEDDPAPSGWPRPAGAPVYVRLLSPPSQSAPARIQSTHATTNRARDASR